MGRTPHSRKEGSKMKEKQQVKFSQTESMGLEDFQEFIRKSLYEQVRGFAIGFVGKFILEEVEALCGKTGEHKKIVILHIVEAASVALLFLMVNE